MCKGHGNKGEAAGSLLIGLWFVILDSYQILVCKTSDFLLVGKILRDKGLVNKSQRDKNVGDKKSRK